MLTAQTLKVIRQFHRYVGLFFAPTILFFSITGGLQMFSFHETSRGSSYVPPAILMHLAQLHKKGTLDIPAAKMAQKAAAKADSAKTGIAKAETKDPASSRNPIAMKLFFAATALALALSTITGIVMCWKFSRRKSLVLVILFLGMVIPVLLAVL